MTQAEIATMKAWAVLQTRETEGRERKRSLLPAAPASVHGPANDICAQAENEFCWGTIWARPAISQKTRSALALGMTTALSQQEGVRTCAEIALTSGWSVSDLAEIILHVQCYAGLYPSLAAIETVKHLVGEKHPDQLHELEVPSATTQQKPADYDPDALKQFGLSVRRDVLGAAMVDSSMQRTRDDPFISMFFDTTHEYCFAKMWGRPALGIRLRSMLSLSTTAALGQSGAIQRHVRSAVEAGLTKKEIGEIFLLVYVYGGVYCALNGFGVAKEVFAELESEGIQAKPGFDDVDSPPL